MITHTYFPSMIKQEGLTLPSGQYGLCSLTSLLFLPHNFISPELCQSPEGTLQCVLTEASDPLCFVSTAGTTPFPRSQRAGTHGWLKQGEVALVLQLMAQFITCCLHTTCHWLPQQAKSSFRPWAAADFWAVSRAIWYTVTNIPMEKVATVFFCSEDNCTRFFRSVVNRRRGITSQKSALTNTFCLTNMKSHIICTPSIHTSLEALSNVPLVRTIPATVQCRTMSATRATTSIRLAMHLPLACKAEGHREDCILYYITCSLTYPLFYDI
jgi:hypothetical protein